MQNSRKFRRLNNGIDEKNLGKKVNARFHSFTLFFLSKRYIIM